jgi:valyl-tRNA synthetase
MGEVPFKEVYIHGLVRDAEGQKMSKSKGNILDPIDLIDGIDLETLVGKRTTGLMQPKDAPKIEKATRKQFPDGIQGYGVDALRYTFASLATQGRDIRFDLGRIEGYRNFCNKIWNAARYVLMSIGDEPLTANPKDLPLGLAERWILARFEQTTGMVIDGIETYRFDLASQAIYEFTWDEYCDWYLEASKTVLTDPNATADEKLATRTVLIHVLEQLLRLQHPIMPFITEEVWQRVAERRGVVSPSIMLQRYPSAPGPRIDEAALTEFEWVKTFVLGVRRIRAEMNIAPGKTLPVLVQYGSTQEHEWLRAYTRYLKGLARIETPQLYTETDSGDMATALAGEMTILIPLADLIDRDAELKRLGNELAKLHQDHERVQAKLANQNYVERAPAEVVAKERQRCDEVAAAIARLEEQVRKIEALKTGSD